MTIRTMLSKYVIDDSHHGRRGDGLWAQHSLTVTLARANEKRASVY